MTENTFRNNTILKSDKKKFQINHTNILKKRFKIDKEENLTAIIDDAINMYVVLMLG